MSMPPAPTKPSAKVAILMRTRDRPILLRRALAGICAQTEPDWLVMLLNDGGDRAQLDAIVGDLTPEHRAKIHVRDIRPSIGHVSGRPLNLGLEESQSQWVSVHDDDDTWAPEFLAHTLARLREDRTNACVCLAEEVHERWNGHSFERLRSQIFNSWQSQGISLFRLAEGNTFPPHCLVYERSVLPVTGTYVEDFEGLEDWAFNLRLWEKFEVSFLPEPLARYHFREPDGVPGLEQNSTVARKDRFGQMDIKVRNRLLREDLAAGRVGLGFLVNMARSHGQLFQEIQKSSPQ